MFGFLDKTLLSLRPRKREKRKIIDILGNKAKRSRRLKLQGVLEEFMNRIELKKPF